MADNKNYFEFIDIPSGNTTERRHVRDAEAQDAIIKPKDLSTLTASSTFVKGDAIALDGKVYRCTADTAAPPFPFVFQGDSIVTQTVNGVECYVVRDTTLNASWVLWMDTNNAAVSAELSARITTKQDAIGDMAQVGTGYGTCTTAGGTAAKVAVLAGYALKPNGIVSILFTNGFTATSPTLNVNGTGAKPILYFGAAINPGKVYDGTQLTMFYDGTSYNVIGIDYNKDSSGGDYVDLGLPSGLLWCTHNVGAESPEDFGLYFSWGNVEGHALDETYSWGQDKDGPYRFTTGSVLTADIAVGETYDAARHNMGAPWRMPTKSEMEELLANCTMTWTTQNGVEGARFTSNINGNTLFMPGASYGYKSDIYIETDIGVFVWSSSIGTESSDYAYALAIRESFSDNGDANRIVGRSVRAVK